MEYRMFLSARICLNGQTHRAKYLILHIILKYYIDIILQRDRVLRADSAVYRHCGVRGIRTDSHLGLSCRESNMPAAYPEDVEYNYQRDFER